MTHMYDQIIATMTSVISSHLYVGQNIQIKTSLIEAGYLKSNATLVSPIKTIQDSSITMHSICDALKTTNCGNRVITQKVISVKIHFQLKYQDLS